MTRFATQFVSRLLLLVAIIVLFCPLLRADDITTIRDRFVRSLLPTNPSDIQHIHDLAAETAQSLRPEGSWPDIDYTSIERSAWPMGQHLSRIVLLAKCARLDRDAGHPDAKLDAQILLALKFWTDHDFKNPNWWWNEIGVPQLLGEISAITWPNIPADQIAAIDTIMKRSVWKTWTGANLTWGVTIQIMRGCLEQSSAEQSSAEQSSAEQSSPTIAEAYARMYQEIRINPQDREGIQADWSFHQHGHQLYSGGYGLAFANDVGRYVSFGWGTSFQIPPEQMRILSSYILDGERWMTYGDIFDYSAIGREITRAGKVAAPKDWSVGSISPAGPAYSLWNTATLLSSLDTPRKQDFAEYTSQLLGDNRAPPVSGNRQFWCSDFMVHRRADFYASVKMFSTRMQNAEIVNREGRKSNHLSDGANLIYVDGNEYRNLFPAWDWNKIPGTTAELVTDLTKDDPKGVGITNKSGFVGGVSDGANGLCTMELVRGKLTAKKSWFFFDHIYLCVGAGISSESDRDVVTCINQCHLVGDVTDDHDSAPRSQGQHDLKGVRWIHHDHVGYVFPESEKVQLSNADQSGHWSDFGTGSDALVTLPVFNLWIDHGPGCKDAKYEYFVLPTATAYATANWAQSPDIDILSNTPIVQAAFDHKSQNMQIAFWNAGEINSPLGNISVDQPCLLMVRTKEDGTAITASNPKNQPMELNVKVGDRSIKFSLPDGLQAGSSVTQRLPS